MDIWRRQYGSDHTDDPAAGSRAEERLAVGLVLGGGAARGFAHIGVLRTLNAYGIRPDVIAGTSIGAVVGGFYAAGQLDVFEDWSRQLTRRRMLGYLDFKLGGSGLIGGGRLADRLDDTIGDTTFCRPAAAARRDRHRGRHRPRNLADPRPPLRGDGGVLCAAGNLPSQADRRPLADGRRAGQPAADLGGARARRPPRHRRQSQRRQFRPRHHHPGPWSGRRGRCHRGRSGCWCAAGAACSRRNG